MRLSMLRHAVGIQKRARHIHNHIPAPAHHQPGLFRHLCDNPGLHVFRFGGLQKGLHVFRRQHHGHALLAFADGQFRAVESLVFFEHLVQINRKAVGQFANGHAHPARTKIVAAFDEFGHFAVFHQPLNLAFGGRIALLHLRTAFAQALRGMRNARPRRPADAVTPRAAASSTTTSPGSGRVRTTSFSRQAPTTAPTSMRLAT